MQILFTAELEHLLQNLNIYSTLSITSANKSEDFVRWLIKPILIVW